MSDAFAICYTCGFVYNVRLSSYCFFVSYVEILFAKPWKWLPSQVKL